ncbi:hypothetical protein QR680_003525 [Steinernema hermaphroditum]|uniref:Uncharacterized protein n=1 Tax=Steinernema hermaphroditum TaxID=289476 RepID=A0AA39HKP9_9BILA|nr:hypothetical protein QR680_003525 [Steinernema hermaphroditum]
MRCKILLTLCLALQVISQIDHDFRIPIPTPLDDALLRCFPKKILFDKRTNSITVDDNRCQEKLAILIPFLLETSECVIDINPDEKELLTDCEPMDAIRKKRSVQYESSEFEHRRKPSKRRVIWPLFSLHIFLFVVYGIFSTLLFIINCRGFRHFESFAFGNELRSQRSVRTVVVDTIEKSNEKFTTKTDSPRLPTPISPDKIGRLTVTFSADPVIPKLSKEKSEIKPSTKSTAEDKPKMSSEGDYGEWMRKMRERFPEKSQKTQKTEEELISVSVDSNEIAILPNSVSSRHSASVRDEQGAHDAPKLKCDSADRIKPCSPKLFKTKRLTTELCTSTNSVDVSLASAAALCKTQGSERSTRSREVLRTLETQRDDEKLSPQRAVTKPESKSTAKGGRKRS